MTYEQVLARAPKSIEAGDRLAAQVFYQFLNTTVFGDASFLATLTDSKQKYLYKLRVTWAKRADGTDTSWLAGGSRPGPRAKPGVPKALTKVFDPSDEEMTYDPLAKSVIDKFSVVTPPMLDPPLTEADVVSLRERFNAQRRKSAA